MHNRCRIISLVLSSVAVPALLLATLAAAQTKPQRLRGLRSRSNRAGGLRKGFFRHSARAHSVAAPEPDIDHRRGPRPVAAGQSGLREPQQSAVGAVSCRPPGDRTQPRVLSVYPFGWTRGRRDQALQRAVWPELAHSPISHTQENRPCTSSRGSATHSGFACFLGALIWLIRVLLENRRWSRIFKLQSEVHGKLIDKFGTNQELALYMRPRPASVSLKRLPSRWALSRNSACRTQLPGCSARFRSALCWFYLVRASFSSVAPVRDGCPDAGARHYSMMPGVDLSSPRGYLGVGRAPGPYA